MPSVRGALQRRWGYQTFQPVTQADLNVATSTGSPVTQLGVYQDDVLVTRKIIVAYPVTNQVFNEDGSDYTPELFPPAAAPLRMLASRSYTYFASGVGADTRKWDGTSQQSGANVGVTKWGIDGAESVTTTVGPNAAGAGTSTPAGGGGTPIIPPIDPPIDIGPINSPHFPPVV